MAWPPPVLPINRINATPQQNNHPADHNAVNQAVNDTVAELTRVTNNTQAALEALRRRGIQVSNASFSSGTPLPAGVTTTIRWDAPDPPDPDGYLPNDSTNIFVPAGLGGLYLVSFDIAVSPAPSAALIMSIRAASVASVGPPAQQANLSFTVSRLVSAGQAISAAIYNGGGAVNCAAILTMFRLGGS